MTPAPVATGVFRCGLTTAQYREPDMAEDKTPALAEATAMPGSKRLKSVTKISDVRLIKMRDGAHTRPAIIYNGDAPKAGDILSFILPNNVEYRGTVKEAVEAAGEVLVEFTDGIAPVTKER